MGGGGSKQAQPKIREPKRVEVKAASTDDESDDRGAASPPSAQSASPTSGGVQPARGSNVTSQRRRTEFLTGFDVAYTWPSGATYRGGMHKGKLHGYGRYESPSGAVYEGEFESDLKQGWGTQKLASSETYSGQYAGGSMSGVGKYFFSSDQGFYIGYWLDNNIEGFGVYEKPGQSKFVGEWKLNQRYGQGWVVRNLGTEEQEQYEGDWIWDKEHGKGLLITSATQYYGYWKEGKRDGPGVLVQYGEAGREFSLAAYNAGELEFQHEMGTASADAVLDGAYQWQDLFSAATERTRRDRRGECAASSWLQARDADMRAKFQSESDSAIRRRGSRPGASSPAEAGPGAQNLTIVSAWTSSADEPEDDVSRKDREILELRKAVDMFKAQAVDAEDRLKDKERALVECGKSIVWLKQQLHDQLKERGEHAPQIQSRIANVLAVDGEVAGLSGTLTKKPSMHADERAQSPITVSPASPTQMQKRNSLHRLRGTIAEKLIVPKRLGALRSPQSFVQHMQEASQKAQESGQRIDELNTTINLLNGSSGSVQEDVVTSMQGTAIGAHLELRQRIERDEQMVAELRAQGKNDEASKAESKLAVDREKLEDALSSLQVELLRERETVRHLREMIEQAGKQQAAESSEERAAMALELDQNRREAAEKAAALERVQQELSMMQEMNTRAGQAEDDFTVQLREANERAAVERGERKKLETELAEQKAMLESRDHRERRLQEQTLSLESQRQELEEEMQALAMQKEEIEDSYRLERANARRLHNEIEDMKGKIRVYARTRPLSDLERDVSQPICVHFPDEFTITVSTTPQTTRRASIGLGRGPSEREYMFDRTFDASSTQQDVFEDCQNLIQSAVDGYNVCAFAYGQTGSGKTWTLSGTEEQPGLARRSMKELFEIRKRTVKQQEMEISCYMVELYNDNLHDLLLQADSKPQKLIIKKDMRDMVCVVGATELPAESYEDLYGIFVRGQENRTTRTTRMNSNSSRSHMIFAIKINSTSRADDSSTLGKLTICDLAGSERLAKTELTDKQGILEAKCINSSLTALGNVISALSKQERHVPYRDNKLTQLMSDSLGGNAKTLMFVNVSPSSYNIDETVSSLNYAARVKLITNQATKAVESMEVKRLKAQIAKLKEGVMIDEYRDID